MKEILIVEDNLSLSDILKGWLEKRGYTAVGAIDEPGHGACCRAVR